MDNDTVVSLYISKPARHIYIPVLSQAVDASSKGSIEWSELKGLYGTGHQANETMFFSW